MHEFSIVQSIVDIALESAALNHIAHISAVEVEVGHASGVVPEAMEFAWEATIKGTILSEASLKIKQITLIVKCSVCQHQYNPEEIYEACPHCGEVNPEILSGKELKVVAIET
jgi:hydrogenase nickel incorporation protein HypA/HybF